MLKVHLSNHFRKDLAKMKKRGLNERKLEKVVLMLANKKQLPPKYRDHALKDSRDFKNVRECHIEPDWLLVYRIENNTLTLFLMRTGSHNDLF